MSDEDAALIGLFPLELVLVPGESVPLHIFEERYRRLVHEHREDRGEFGIVLQEEDHLHEVGCSVKITAVLQEMPDGRVDIVVEGLRRFRVLELRTPEDAEIDYLRAVVEYFDDVEHGSGEARAETVDAFTRLLRARGAERPLVSEGAGTLSFDLAAVIDFGTDVKQALLESDSETERLENLRAVIEALIPRVEEQRKHAEAIRGNGKGN
jgi:ATP-dependent Lon protease